MGKYWKSERDIHLWKGNDRDYIWLKKEEHEGLVRLLKEKSQKKKG